MSKESGSQGVARVGKYIMLDVLGEGAFGKVRLAVDEESGKEYAIKIMEKSHIKANELTLQVRREIAVMKAMRHPNIVNLHEVLTSSKNLYMVMDLVTGGELFDAVAQHGRLSESQTRLYFQQLVDGVCYCHSRRVFHRDLKPENLLLSGDKQTIKITDFGLSSIKAQDASSELLHTVMGSPHYIAPEIITSAAAGYDGGKVDVWACGVILFGMLAGYLPFDEPDTKDLYKAIVRGSVRYPPHFSYDVIKLLRAMLQKDPNRRPSVEQVKTFAWFKVDYEPAVVPEGPRSSGSSSQGKKPRLKVKKRSDRLGRQKRKDAAAQAKQTSQPEDHIESGPQNESSTTQPSDAKPISELFRDSSRNSSVSSRGKSGGTSLAGTPNTSTIGQENVDPHQDLSRAQKLPSANYDGREEAPVSTEVVLAAKNPQDELLQRVEKKAETSALQSQRNSRLTPDDGPGMHASRQPELAMQQYGTTGTLRSGIPVVSAPKFADRTISTDIDVEANLLQSPLTPQVSRFSSAQSSVGSGPEERQQEARVIKQENGGMKQASLNDFVSPISEYSQSSFASPSAENKTSAFLSPNYRALVPSLFTSQDSLPADYDLRKESDASNVNHDAIVTKRNESARLSPIAETDAITTEKAAQGEAIFRPMKSLFKTLIESSSAMKPTPSMAPSVLCPEVEYDSDGAPQWCIDSTEVFADVDSEEIEDEPPSTSSTRTSQKLLNLLKQADAESCKSDGPSKPKSIFAPLDSDIALKLTPAKGTERKDSGPFPALGAKEDV